MTRRQLLGLAASATLLGGFATPSQAQGSADWPARPVRFILSQPAGAGPDAMARLLAEPLARRLGQPIVIENKPGGQNAIGAQAAATATADGYTFYFATAAALVTNPWLFRNLPYDPSRDFTPVGMVGVVPFAISVHPSSRLTTLPDLLAHARARPGRLAIANEGPKTFGGIMTRVLTAQAGVEANVVPYASVKAAVTDAIGGQVEVVVSDLPSIASLVQAGRLRMLAVTTAERVTGWEAVPTVAEQLPGYDFAGWVGLVAPTGTPPAIIAKLNQALDAVLNDPDIAARLLAIGPRTRGAGTPAAMAAMLQKEKVRWAGLVKTLNIQPE